MLPFRDFVSTAGSDAGSLQLENRKLNESIVYCGADRSNYRVFGHVFRCNFWDSTLLKVPQ
jgi:hypothetical protein